MARSSGVVALLLALIVGVAGCASDAKTPPEEEIWAGVKLADLAPPPGDRFPLSQVLGTVNMEIHAIDLPADNIERLTDLWQMLSPGTIRMNSYFAFTENSFRVKFGERAQWNKILELLARADGQRVATTSLVVPDNDTTDLPIARLPVGRPIGFLGNDLSRQSANVGPGLLSLRLRAEPIAGARGVRKIIAYPVYTPPLAGSIPQLRARARQREFYFASAAFALQMSPGDLVVLGPEEYTGERRTLGGLFFNNLEGTLFFNPNKRLPPAYKPAVRLYVLICTGITD